jgi:prepilin-type N-terminal cleavage/methylation domain-containing protein
MRSLRRTAQRHPADQGFTLVEVVVALVLLAMVAVTTAGLYIRAMRNTAGLDRRQTAVGVAAQSMELARSIPPVRDATTHYSKLIGGRTAAAVAAQWSAALADLSQTDQESDAAATASSVPLLPMSSTSTVAGVAYTSQQLVGSCWRPAAGGDCVKAAVKVAGSVFMYRVVVQVTWTDTVAASCPGGTCNYVLSSLVDPSTDPSFNVNATNATWPDPPSLHTVTTTTTANTPVTVDLQSSVTSGASPLIASVSSVTQSATATVLPNTTTVTVTPATGFYSGPVVVVTFAITDPYGQSATSTLSVTVNPPAAPTVANCTVTGKKNTTFAANLSGCVSGGTGPFSYVVYQPTKGSLYDAPGGVQASQPFTAYPATLTDSRLYVYPGTGGAGTGVATFSYRVSDGYGHTATATVSVNTTN